MSLPRLPRLPLPGRPDRAELAGTALVLVAGAVLLLSPDARAVAFQLLEIVGRVVDRPTTLLVAVYVLLSVGAAAMEPWQDRLPRELVPVWVALCCLALLGQGYLLAFAAITHPAWLAGALLLLILPWKSARPAPVVALFVVLHLLVEGAAGHVITPWLHDVNAGMADLSRGWLYWPLIAALVAVPAVGAARAELRWPHLDPRHMVQAAAPWSLAALAVVALHYGTAMWACPPADDPGLRLVSPEAGAFDLEVSADSQRLLVSRREPRELVLLDLQAESAGSGAVAAATPIRLSTASPDDSAFNRTEPETLLALPDGRFVVLIASSDSEQGNRLVVLDPQTRSLSAPMAARGVSDLVDDGAGGIWASTEFAGRLLRLDPDLARPLERIDVAGAETNKVLVEGASKQAWSVGLWRDDLLRLIDVEQGVQTGAVPVGTHQWDLALSRQRRLLFVPRLVAGELLAFDADTLAARGQLPARFGVRPVEVTPDGDTVITGNLYTGEVVGHSVVDGEERFRRRIGGHLKALEVGPRGRVFAGSNCGVYEILHTKAPTGAAGDH